MPADNPPCQGRFHPASQVLWVEDGFGHRYSRCSRLLLHGVGRTWPDIMPRSDTAAAEPNDSVRIRLLRRVTLILIAALLGCSDGGTTQPPDTSGPVGITGRWQNVQGEPTNTTLSLNLTESDNGNVTGTGSLQLVTVSANLTITGSNTGNAIQLLLAAPTQLTQDIRLNGFLRSDSQIRAELRGAGFVAGDSVTLILQ